MSLFRRPVLFYCNFKVKLSQKYGCNTVCADFHVMFVHKKDEKQNLDTTHHLYVLASESEVGSEKRLPFVSLKKDWFSQMTPY